MQRRHFLHAAGGALAAAAAPGWARPRMADNLPAGAPPPDLGHFARTVPLAPIRASADRIIAINVCTRPFRAQGPRIEAEQVGRRTVIHNYGHGGSGWSLSWGAAQDAVALARATGQSRIAVVGCGAIGLTTALVAQRAGLQVRIYAKELPPDVRSFYATGVWSPDSRICTAEHVTPEFERRWERQARTSFRTYQTLLGLPGEPIEWRDGYALSDVPFDQPTGTGGESGEPHYPGLESRLLRDLGPRSRALAAGQYPFPVQYVRAYTQMTFNIAAYARLLIEDFRRAGGQVEIAEFAGLDELARLPEKTVVNATGYGARALLGDESVVPVCGQTARLVPQPEVDYGLSWRGHNLFVVPRRDGILVQAQAPGDFGNPDDRVDRAASEAAVAQLATLFPAPVPSPAGA